MLNSSTRHLAKVEDPFSLVSILTSSGTIFGDAESLELKQWYLYTQNVIWSGTIDRPFYAKPRSHFQKNKNDQQDPLTYCDHLMYSETRQK